MLAGSLTFRTVFDIAQVGVAPSVGRNLMTLVVRVFYSLHCLLVVDAIP